MANETVTQQQRPARRQRCPEAAQDALDLVLRTGFATFEQGLDAIEARLNGAAPINALTLPHWIDIIKRHAGTDLATIEGVAPQWRAVACSTIFDASVRQLHVWRGCSGRGACYDASLSALEMLNHECGFLKTDTHRIWRKLVRESDDSKGWEGRSRVNAFDWYVKMVHALQDARCRNRRASEASGTGGAS